MIHDLAIETVWTEFQPCRKWDIKTFFSFALQTARSNNPLGSRSKWNMPGRSNGTVKTLPRRSGEGSP